MYDERTGLEILDEGECWELTASKEVGRLGIAIGNEPDIFPINYKVDDRVIYMNTLPGTKLAGAVLGAKVAFEIDDLDDDDHQGWSVVIHGTASEIEGTEEVMRVEELGIRPWSDAERLRYMRIDADSISGRRIGRT